MDPNPDYVIDAARGADVAEEILAFYDAQPKTGLRAVAREEIEAMSSAGFFFIARDGHTGHIVATLYFTCHGFQDGQLVYEIGGATVAPGHRESGVMACLANCGLVSFALAGTLSDTDARPLVRLIGLVEKSNEAPVALLTGVGFREVGEEELPADKPGVAHMRKDDGPIIARRFEYDFKELHKRVDQAIGWRDAAVLKPARALQPGEAPKSVRIDLPHFAPTPEGDPLAGLLDAARRMADGR